MTLKFDDKKIPYIDCGKYIIRLESEDPTENDLEKARKELRELPEIAEQAIKNLRALILNEPRFHFPTEENYLRIFLRPCKYYPESAFKRVKSFCKFKLKYPKVSEDVTPSSLRHVFEQGILRLLPLRDQHGRRILILEVGKQWKPSKCPLTDIFRAVQLAVLASMVEPVTQINGGIILLDMDGLSLNHVTQFTPSFASMILEYVQECLCLRLKNVHVVNNSYIFNMIFAIFKPFIGEKLRKRIFFHGKDWLSLTSHIEKQYLPEKYGGSLDLAYPSGHVLANLFDCYRKDLEMAATYGYTKS